MLSRHDRRLHSKFDNLDSDYHMALQMVQCMLCLWHDLRINQMTIENVISFKKKKIKIPFYSRKSDIHPKNQLT